MTIFGMAPPQLGAPQYANPEGDLNRGLNSGYRDCQHRRLPVSLPSPLRSSTGGARHEHEIYGACPLYCPVGRHLRRECPNAGGQVAAGSQAARAAGRTTTAQLAAQSRIGRWRQQPIHYRATAGSEHADADAAGTGTAAHDPVALGHESEKACPGFQKTIMLKQKARP